MVIPVQALVASRVRVGALLNVRPQFNSSQILQCSLCN
jgi:hypothetical protein